MPRCPVPCMPLSRQPFNASLTDRLHGISDVEADSGGWAAPLSMKLTIVWGCRAGGGVPARRHDFWWPPSARHEIECDLESRDGPWGHAVR